MNLKDLDWKKWGCIAFFLAAVFASLFANTYRKQAINERQTRERTQASLNAQSEALLDWQSKYVYASNQLAEKDLLLKQSQKGSKSETVNADGSRTSREDWENTSDEISRQLETQTVELSNEKSVNQKLMTDLSESQASVVALAEKMTVITTKAPNFRPWGILAGRMGAGIGYHVDLGFMDLGTYAKNASYKEFAPELEINARF